MEKELKIKIPGTKKFVYATQRGSLSKPLIIFVHGLTGSMNEHIFFNGARFFEKNGFSSLRFNLYYWPKDARQMGECSLLTHAQDLDCVIDYCRKHGANKIFVVGHSYGGPTVLLSPKKKFDGVVLWDPTYDVKNVLKNTRFVKELGGYRLRWDFDVIIGKKMFDFSSTINCAPLIKNIKVPIKIICAGNGALGESSKKYFKSANKPKGLAIIKNADHNFNFDGTEENLFKETLSWLEQYC